EGISPEEIGCANQLQYWDDRCAFNGRRRVTRTGGAAISGVRTALSLETRDNLARFRDGRFIFLGAPGLERVLKDAGVGLVPRVGPRGSRNQAEGSSKEKTSQAQHHSPPGTPRSPVRWSGLFTRQKIIGASCPRPLGIAQRVMP